MDGYKELLSELAGRLDQYPPYRPLSEYNIFQVLGVEAKEVVMCRFLADLLDPEGKHGLGILFLKTFLQSVLEDHPMSDALLARTEVVTEYVIEENRRIDIVIRNEQYFIPVEVKIYAGEEKGQCFDYYKHAQNAPILYLTRFGDAPSEYSRGQKDGPGLLPLDWDCIRCISWSRDILRWLTSLLPQLSGPIKPMVEQYIDTIHRFADEGERRRMEQSVQAALMSPAFFGAGLELERSMNKAKLTLMRLVFECFKQEMAPVAEKYGLELERDTFYYSYEAPQHEKFYDTAAGTWPGLNYVVKRAVFQNKNLQMWFRIEVDSNLFAGLALFDTQAKPQGGYPKGCQVDRITPELKQEIFQYLDPDVVTAYDWWLTWCYPNGKRQEGSYPDVPNFRTMNPCAVELVDPQKRLQFVQSAIAIFEAQLLKHLL